MLAFQIAPQNPMPSVKLSLAVAGKTVFVAINVSGQIACRRLLSPVISHHECVKRHLILLTPVTVVTIADQNSSIRIFPIFPYRNFLVQDWNDRHRNNLK